MTDQHPTESGNDTLPELPDQGQRDGNYEEAKNADAADHSSLETPPADGTGPDGAASVDADSSDDSVDGSNDHGGSKPSGQSGNYAGTDAVDETVPVQD